MALNVKTGPTREPLRILLHGVEGIGKTTFASKFPDAIFIAPEDGGGDLDIARLETGNWKQASTHIRALIDEPHNFRTLVIDTVDFLERLCFQHVMVENKVTTIEEVGGGYGKGWIAANEEQVRFVKLLDQLRDQRRMHIVALAHTEIKTFNDPEAASYDRYQLRMDKRQVALWSEWVDAILFANYEIKVRTQAGGKTADILKKGKAAAGTPDRVLFTERRAAFNAKNRYSLPPELPLEWDEFAKAIKWAERDAAIRANVRVPTAAELKAAIDDAQRNRDWTREEVIALVAPATKASEVPEDARAAMIAALRVDHTKHAENK